MTDAVNWGVLGHARIARTSVIPAINRAPNARLLGVASRQAADLPRDQWPRNYDSYQAVLADPAIQAVYIPLPNALHKEWVVKALAAGKHVLCEKPLGLTADETRTMQNAAQQHQRLLMEAFMYRYTDRSAQLQAVLASGVLGQLRHISASFRFLLDRTNTIKEQPALGGGALYDVGCYPVNFITMVTGRLPLACKVIYERAPSGVDNNLTALLRYDDGLLATVNCGFNAFGRNYAEIIGTQGLLRIEDPFLGSAGQLTLQTAQGSTLIEVAETDRYQAEIVDFSKAILTANPPQLTLEESLINAQVMDMIIAAMHQQ